MIISPFLLVLLLLRVDVEDCFLELSKKELSTNLFVSVISNYHANNKLLSYSLGISYSVIMLTDHSMISCYKFGILFLYF
jgi:hypothetical protein